MEGAKELFCIIKHCAK